MFCLRFRESSPPYVALCGMQKSWLRHLRLEEIVCSDRKVIRDNGVERSHHKIADNFGIFQINKMKLLVV